MAERPIKDALPADLPENWQAEQIVAPTGEEVGLSHQHGYNYLMEMVNRAQRGVNSVNEAFDSVSGKRTCRFVVGTSTAGWTAADCDYLCDGTDDQVEIQAAIDALPKNENNYMLGGEIILLSGTYHLSGHLMLIQNIILRGNGDSTVLLRETDDGAGSIKSLVALGTNCLLADMAIDGNNKAPEGYSVSNDFDSTIENITFTGRFLMEEGADIYVSGSFTSSYMRHAEISNCRFSDRTAIYLKGSNCLRVQNNFADRINFIKSAPNCGARVIISGNAGSFGFGCGSIHLDGIREGSIIEGNDINHLEILDTQTATGRISERTIVAGNVFKPYNENSEETAVILGANTSGIFVTGNLFCNENAPVYGVQDNGTGNIVRFNSNDLSGSGGTPTTVAQAVPAISVTEDGLVTATATQAAGNVAAGTKSAARQLSAQDDPDLVPENIREGVSIFGVQGAMQAGTGGVTSETVAVIVTLTETEYNALSAKDPSTLYLIKE